MPVTRSGSRVAAASAMPIASGSSNTLPTTHTPVAPRARRVRDATTHNASDTGSLISPIVANANTARTRGVNRRGRAAAAGPTTSNPTTSTLPTRNSGKRKEGQAQLEQGQRPEPRQNSRVEDEEWRGIGEIIVLSSDDDIYAVDKEVEVINLANADSPSPPKKKRLSITRREEHSGSFASATASSSTSGRKDVKVDKGKGKARAGVRSSNTIVGGSRAGPSTPVRNIARAGDTSGVSARGDISFMSPTRRLAEGFSPRLPNADDDVVSGLRHHLEWYRKRYAESKAEVDRLKAQVEEVKQEKKKLVDELEDIVTCEICTTKMWSPYMISECGHVFCQPCLLKWFDTIYMAHVVANPGYLQDGPVLPRQMHRNRHNHHVAAQIRQAVDNYWMNIPRPRYTCPTCRVAVKKAPVVVFRLRDVAKVILKAEPQGEGDQSNTPAEGRVGAFDDFFKKKDGYLIARES